MQIAPRYDGPVVLEMDGPDDEPAAPFTAHRQRLLDRLATLDDDQWAAPSRCDAWAVRDVVAHLTTVDDFWVGSINAGLAGTPTKVLTRFDPVATPPLLVTTVADLTPAELLERFAAGSATLLDLVAGLAGDDWTALGESPAGHVPVRFLVQHALWDGWIHERDILLPLGLDAVEDPAEVGCCLRFAAAISPVLGLGLGRSVPGALAVEATGPDLGLVIDVDDRVRVAHDVAPDRPTLRGDAVALVEALSLRAPLPATAPAEWTALLAGLEAAFDA